MTTIPLLPVCLARPCEQGAVGATNPGCCCCICAGCGCAVQFQQLLTSSPAILRQQQVRCHSFVGRRFLTRGMMEVQKCAACAHLRYLSVQFQPAADFQSFSTRTMSHTNSIQPAPLEMRGSPLRNGGSPPSAAYWATRTSTLSVCTNRTAKGSKTCRNNEGTVLGFEQNVAASPAIGSHDSQG
jgi:hypothetical protein